MTINTYRLILASCLAALFTCSTAWAEAGTAADRASGNASTRDMASDPVPSAKDDTKPAKQAKPSYLVTSSKDPKPATIGSLEPDSGFKMQVKLNYYGAAIYQIALTDHFQTAQREDPYIIQERIKAEEESCDPFAARNIVVDGTAVDLLYVRWEREPVKQTDDAHEVTYTAIVKKDNVPQLRITRRYVLHKNSYEVECYQAFTNLTAREMRVRYQQYAQGDMMLLSQYAGDRRELVAGYYAVGRDPNRTRINTSGAWQNRVSVLDERQEGLDEGNFKGLTARPLWPAPGQDVELIWIASLNRYFATVVHRPLRKTGEGEDAQLKPIPLDDYFQPGMQVIGKKTDQGDGRKAIFLLTSDEITLAGDGKPVHRDLAIYAGPRYRQIFSESPYAELGLDELLKYEVGCTWCTFQSLARLMLWFLDFIHAITFDWGIAIIILVLVVRLMLHPITKRSQIQMTKFSKQMQELQPELQKLKKKYENDSQKFQQEQMKLWREKNINPASFAMGCLPMFLQMPIWVALYAMLYSAIELRHQPAFYGVFQQFGGWIFLADLSSPDNFIKFGEGGFHLPICNTYIPAALNILPILMAIFFYMQQKLLTPPPATDEQAQQQKMMKWMVLLFPVMLYAAPSGLTLYIMASSIAGMLDGYMVRKHIKQMEEEGTLFKKKPRKPGGVMDRLSKFVEAKQAEADALQKHHRKGGGRKKR